MADKLAAALHGSELNRRRELNGMTKSELVDYILNVEDNLHALSARIDAAYGDQP